MDDEKITITIDREHVLGRCVAAVLQGNYEDDVEDEFDSHGGAYLFNQRMRKLVEGRVAERVDELVGEIAREKIERLVHEQIEKQVAEGFPIFDEYGKRTSVEPFAAYVRKAIDGMFGQERRYGRRPRAVTMAEEAFRANVEQAFKDEVEAIRKRVRSYVDEQLAGEVVKSLRSAVGLNR